MQPLCILLLALLFAGCSTQGSVGVIPQSNRTPGLPRLLYGSSVTPWAVIGEDGSVDSIGFSIPMAAIQSAPTAESRDDPKKRDPSDGVRLELPDAVRGKTSIDHIDLDYNPAGYPSDGAYDVPLFAARFYRIGAAEQARIDCSDDSPVDGNRLAAGYVLTKPGRPPRGACTSMMGNHAFRIAGPEFTKGSGGLDGLSDSLGYYANRLIFIEPMIARSLLLRREQGSAALPRPIVIEGWTGYPSQMNLVYDKKTDAYDMWLDFPPADGR